jgi:hypothetical protein
VTTFGRQALAMLILAAAARGACAGAIVVAKASPLQTMTMDEASRVFTGRQHNLQSQPVTALWQRSGPVREEFNQKILGRTGPELSSYLAALVFTGRCVAPVELTNDEQVKQTLIANPNDVGYISDEAIDDSVRVLLKY